MASREDIKHSNLRTNSLKTIILEHNYLNGFKFVIVEFGIFILVIAPYCLYYFFHYKFLLAGIASGLISNFIVVLFFAVRSVSRKESSLGITKLYHRKTLAEVKNKYPDLPRNTTIFVISLLLPFVVPVIIFAEHFLKIKH